MSGPASESGGDKYSAVKNAADEAAATPNVADPAASVVPPTALPETYDNQVKLNMEAHRKMRTWAFFGVAGVALVFFVMMMGAFCTIFFDKHLVMAVAVSEQGNQWHVLVLMGAVLVLFAAIPLSLCLAILKMISDKDSREGAEMKAPSVELVKAIADILKGIAESLKG